MYSSKQMTGVLGLTDYRYGSKCTPSWCYKYQNLDLEGAPNHRTQPHESNQGHLYRADMGKQSRNGKGNLPQFHNFD